MSILFEYMEGFSDEEISQWENTRPKRTCLYCKEQLPPSSFRKHSHSKDNLDTRCKSCLKIHSKIRDNLRSIAPSKPEFCECCGRVPNVWHIDHDHKTLEIRGWLCDQCNAGIGQLGDTVESVKKALTYLKRCRKEYNKRNAWIVKEKEN